MTYERKGKGRRTLIETLFERLRSEGAQLITEMIEGEYQETLTLDFKANVEETGNPLFDNCGKKLTKTGRKAIAKAASAFANSMGGILILGVDCRTIDGVDCAREITPISQLSRVLSTINNELHSITVPSITGIEAIDIPIGEGSSGLIAVSIPRSDRRPHRSNAPDARSYFKRSGTSTVEMEHYEIEDAFLSNLSPELILSCPIDSAGSGGAGGRSGERVYHIRANLFVENTGGGTAKHVFLECRHDQGAMQNFGGRHTTSENQVGVVDGTLQAALPADFLVHPGTKRRIEGFQIQAYYNVGSNEVRIGNNVFDACSTQSFVFEFTISAEGMRQKHLRVEFELSDLIFAARIPVHMA